MKVIMLVITILLVVILRLNLPPKDISENLSLKKKDFFSELTSKLAYSDTVADWQHLDLLLVRYACSERVHVSLIGFPFNQWKVYNDKITSCN